MKKMWITTFILAFAIMGFVRSENDKKESAKKPEAPKSQIEKELDSIVVNYDSTAFKALYSIDDFRPNSIISIDKISAMYENKWLSPAMVVNKLTKEDKRLLIKSTAEYIESFDDAGYRANVIKKLKYWCMADLQFIFMYKKLGVEQDMIIKAVTNVPSVQDIVSRFMVDQPQGRAKLNKEMKEQAYDHILNYLCTLPPAEQYKYFSDVFGNLAILSRN